ncbi:MAG TPA: methyltransferase domain-containing protein [Solirubrobacteraceae bacterium]|jgi:SAM-dependent methyltransferase|nr:methyltransferase domain-containing protein [Solirubrobacteraceae bacterium]
MTQLSRRLQLGAFDQACEGWVNTDVTPHLLVARVPGLARALHVAGVLDEERRRQHLEGRFRSLRWLDVSRRFRFPDRSFEAVYCSHLLEHLHPDVAEQCLREILRVLVPGGVLRIAVPDLDAMVEQYDPTDPDRFLWGVFQGRGARAKASARHWWHYNAVSLEALLRRLGYTEVRRCEFQQGRCPDLERIETRPWSLFMEALSPGG